MTTMLEKAARAAYQIDQEHPWPSDHYFDVARAVLMAVREPDGSVSAAGYKAIRGCQWWEEDEAGGYEVTPSDSGAEAFAAMIDAILNEGKSDV